jgi:hypothetical protein
MTSVFGTEDEGSIPSLAAKTKWFFDLLKTKNADVMEW